MEEVPSGSLGPKMAMRILALLLAVEADLRVNTSQNQTSGMPYCPSTWVACGSCDCVKPSRCHLCPVVSTKPGCGANFYDCGRCECVPYIMCEHCGERSANHSGATLRI